MSRLLYHVPLYTSTDVYGHCSLEATQFGPNKEKGILVLGGAPQKPSDNKFHMEFYCIKQETFRTVPSKGSIPSLKMFHTCQIYQNKVYLFGGVNSKDKTISSKLYSFDMSILIWEQLGEPNAFARYGHTCSILKNELIFFGGIGRSSDIKSISSLNRCDIYEIDSKNNKWKSISQNCPSSRAFHTEIVIGESVFIFGGYNIEKQEALNDLHKFTNGVWTKMNFSSGMILDVFSSKKPIHPRFGHNMLHFDSKVIFLNGMNMKSQILSLEYIEDDDLKMKSINSRRKMDMVFSHPLLLQRFQGFAVTESNEDYVTLKKHILEFKKKRTNKKPIIEEIFKSLQTLSFSSRTIEMLQKNAFKEEEDLYNHLEAELDTLLIGMIHRFSHSEQGNNIFEIPVHKISKKKSNLRNFIHSDFPDDWNMSILFRTLHSVESWLFTVGGMNDQLFVYFLHTLRDLTIE